MMTLCECLHTTEQSQAIKGRIYSTDAPFQCKSILISPACIEYLYQVIVLIVTADTVFLCK